MALKTDDCDIREVYMQTLFGGNGDYYIVLYEYPNKECSNSGDEFKVINYRMAMSGGFTSRHPEVREAFVALFRAMEKSGLNEHPTDRREG
jgi:hypothetical protein